MTFKGLLVSQVNDEFKAEVTELNESSLPDGDITIDVSYSSINYKDALSFSGNKGVTAEFPHVPGIDAAGVVRESSHSDFKPGDNVLVTGYDLGMNTWGGFSQTIRVPAHWVLPLPEGLTPYESMAFGTAGLTAGLCINKLLLNGLSPEQGPVIVSGASGGVGSIAVQILNKLGFEVTAVSRRASMTDFLKQLGATTVISQDVLLEKNSKPMLKPMYAGAVDVAGGEVLEAIIKQLLPSGSVSCCGLVNSPKLSLSVFPFILRGVNLLGVDSVEIDLQEKNKVWQKLAGEWKVLPKANTIGLDKLVSVLTDTLNGQSQGRYVLKHGD